MSLCGTGAVYRLESRFASLVGHPHTLAVANATLGLSAVFMAFGIHAADVITTPYTWGGTLAGLILTGNRPVFVDIERETLTLDPKEVARHITRRTKAILAVDIYGYPSNGPALRNIADNHGLVLIQDCAQSFGAYLGDHHTGWWADAAVFSLSWGKALFAGEGGVLVTPHREVFERLIWETQHPHRQLRDVPHLPANELGLNLRMNPLAAIWADALFDDAVVGVERNVKECVEILALLQRQGMSRTKLSCGRSVKPSFHVLTFEPDCEPERVELFLGETDGCYQLSSPPIKEPIYGHTTYHELARKHGWRKINRCPGAEQQCKSRLRLLKRNVLRGDR